MTDTAKPPLAERLQTAATNLEWGNPTGNLVELLREAATAVDDRASFDAIAADAIDAGPDLLTRMIEVVEGATFTDAGRQARAAALLAELQTWQIGHGQ
jgi:hypothetical protein